MKLELYSNPEPVPENFANGQFDYVRDCYCLVYLYACLSAAELSRKYPDRQFWIYEQGGHWSVLTRSEPRQT